MTTQDRLRTLLDETVGRQLSTNVRDIDDDTNLFELGLDSIGFINVIMQIEKVFDVVIEQDEMDLEHFNTIRAMATSITSKEAKANP